MTAAGTLGSISEPARARPVLAKLESMAANDGHRRVRSAAERTIEAIEKGEPAQVQLAELRDELKEMTEKSKDLADRLEKLESKTGEVDEEESPEENPEESPES